MTRTTFIPRRTLITAEWLNKVDSFVETGLQGDPGFGTINFTSFYTNGAFASVTQALEEACLFAKTLIDEGVYSRVTLDLNGKTWYVPAPGFVVPNAVVSLTIRNGTFAAGDGDWTETDSDDIAFWNKYQTVTSEGKTWSLRKPVVSINYNNTGIELVDIVINGRGLGASRLSAGLRIKSGSGNKWLRNVLVNDCESYGIFAGSDLPNTGEINMDGVEVKVNGRTNRMDRTSYGVVMAGNDQHWHRLDIHYAHCCLLVAETGATTHLVDYDFFNGASFDPGTYYHRVMEYHGNSNIFGTGRWGNGCCYMYTTRIAIGPAKFGATEGLGSFPPGYFICYPSKVDDDLRNFVLHYGDIPSEFTDGSLPWFSLRPDPLDLFSWSIDGTKISSVNGYVTTLPKGQTNLLQAKGTSDTLTFHTLTDGCYTYWKDKTTTDDVGLGVYSSSLRFKTNSVDRWSILSNGNLKPVVDNAVTIGSPAEKPSAIYSYSYYVDSNQVVGPRQTGWTAGTGTANKGAFATGTATTADCAQRILALEQALRTHGLIN